MTLPRIAPDATARQCEKAFDDAYAEVPRLYAEGRETAEADVEVDRRLDVEVDRRLALLRATGIA